MAGIWGSQYDLLGRLLKIYFPSLREVIRPLCGIQNHLCHRGNEDEGI